MKIGKYTFFEAKEQRALGADHIKQKTKEANKGSLENSYAWTERIDHPAYMGNYEEWSKDPEAAEALLVLTKLIAGVGFRTEATDGDEKDPNKLKIDKWAQDVGADESLEKNTWQMLAKGFSPAEIITGYDSQLDLKTLPAETFYIYRDKKGTVTRYTQERTVGDKLAEWKGDELKDIVRFINQETPLRPYGTAILDSIGTLLDMRKGLNEDMGKGIHRWANPIPIIQTVKSKANSTELKKSLEEREADDWVLIYDVAEKEIRVEPLTVEPAARFVPYVDMIYTQIAEGLHAPLLLYLKSATEASAHVMMESVDRFVDGSQRHIRRRYERQIFPRIVNDPIPKMLFGEPQSGMEKVTAQDLAALVNSPKLAYNQAIELLKQYGIRLPDPDWKSGPPQLVLAPKTLFQPEKPAPKVEILDEKMVERLNDLDMGLEIIASNFDTGRLSVPDTSKMAYRAIEAWMKRNQPEDWEQLTQERWRRFMKEKVVTHS